jgi:predicted RNA-binding protein with TRAM domain
VGISVEVSIGMTIRSAKITGMEPIAKIKGFTIFVKTAF